jgi:hypothetical protein
MTERSKNIFDVISKIIPGYKGYAIRDEKRNGEKQFRSTIASTLLTCEKAIVSYQQSMNRIDKTIVSQEWEIARKSLNTVSFKIKHATYGESSFFSEHQLKEDELDHIYKLDLEISERVDLINETLKHRIEETLSPVTVNKQINEIDQIMNRRTLFINQYK